MTTSRCKTCGKEIIWVTTPSGKSMPVDTPGVTMWRIDPEGAQTGSPKAVQVRVFQSHFASCPQAGQWRREP